METVTRNWSDISRKVLGGLVGAIVAGTATVSGLDSVILWLWNGVFGLAGTGAEMPATVAAVIGTALGAFIGGYLPKETLAADATVTPSSGSVLRSPPIATGLSFLAALALMGTFLVGGCASVSAGRDATVQQRVDAARVDLATAGVFVDLYAAFPRCGAGVQQPCSNANVVALLVKGRATAAAALDAVDALIGEGAPEARILAALIEAQRAIVVVENLRSNAAPAAW
jgi:hypothetical protein